MATCATRCPETASAIRRTTKEWRHAQLFAGEGDDAIPWSGALRMVCALCYGAESGGSNHEIHARHDERKYIISIDL
jgi:hypothetical protein